MADSPQVPLQFDGVKIFSATKLKEREALGEAITTWLETHGATVTIVDKVVSQSSDQAYHCLTITLFYQNDP